MPRSSQPARPVRGLHHITAIAGPAQENLDFYVGVMGMRLVKRSVNQDAPGTYHLFYADGVGHAGTDLTFFPWPEMGPGRRGTGLPKKRAKTSSKSGHPTMETDMNGEFTYEVEGHANHLA